MKFFAIAFIKGYQLIISPLFLPSCRFYPTCSEFTLQSVKKYGFFKGVWRGVVRLSKCHPFHSGGYNPVD